MPLDLSSFARPLMFASVMYFMQPASSRPYFQLWRDWIGFNAWSGIGHGVGFLSWLNNLFEAPEQYGIPSVTLTGQQVRSRGEKIIADYLTYHGVAYYYEAQAMSNDWFIFKQKISRPDFFLPQYNLFVEYWGLVDSPDSGTRNDYVRTMRWKMAQYH